MSSLLHLSDTHFGAERPEVCRALLGLARSLAPDFIVWSGDITQRATREQFRDARAFADALPMAPLMVLPGNHDIPLFALVQRLLQPYARFRDAFGPTLEPTLDAMGWQVTAVNTVRRWRQQHGVLSSSQIERVARRLRQAPRGTWRIVVSHHPLTVDRAEDDGQRPWRSARALDAWTSHDVDVLLGGHTHQPFIATLPRHGFQVQSGTAVSRRTRPGTANSVSLLVQDERDWPPARFAARWDYSHHERRFIERERQRLD